MKVPLHFGEDVIELEIPKKNLAGILQPKKWIFDSIDGDILASAVKRGCTGFKEQVLGRSVGVLLPDGTRDLPLGDMLPLLLPLLKDARKVLFFLCTGSHNSQTAPNSLIISAIQAQAALARIMEYEVISHDCQKAEFAEAGVTRQGTTVLYNSRLDKIDVFVALSDIKHHYFAGYSNPIKNIVPGLCAFKTIEQNHSLTFDDRSLAGTHPWHPDTSRQ